MMKKIILIFLWILTINRPAIGSDDMDQLNDRFSNLSVSIPGSDRLNLDDYISGIIIGPKNYVTRAKLAPSNHSQFAR